MILLPAIDLYEGKAVRLLKGDYANMTVYSTDPMAVAQDFAACGAGYVHMVDLEGARDGTTPNLDIVQRVAAKTGLFVEIGGGIRSMETVDRYLQNGVSRVILGTAAVENPAFLEAAVAKYGEKVAVGADIRDGKLAIRGWLETAETPLEDFLSHLQTLGVRNIICTDISRDGAMRGANRALYGELSRKFALDFTASGGVSSMEDIRELRKMDLYGAILGKAYYTGAVDLKEALEAAR